MIAVLEGGYHLDGLATSGAALTRVLLGEAPAAPAGEAHPVVDAAARRVSRDARALLAGDRVIYRDRIDAGERLGRHLAGRLTERGSDVIVLGIPRGGVVVAAPVAGCLGALLDVTVPRKLGAPGNPELAIGALAVADGEDIVVLNRRTIEYLRVQPEHIDRTVAASGRRSRAGRVSTAARVPPNRWPAARS